jgi:hypothetical protein
MNRALTRLSLVCLAAGSLAAQEKTFTPTIKTSGLIQLWYTQMLDTNLRNNAAGTTYYDPGSQFKENGFTVRRTELKFSGEIVQDVAWEVMIDPSISTSPTNPSILQDVAITYKMGGGFDLKIGQFKNLQTLEGLTSSSDLMFVNRSQLGTRFGDKRDRGGVLGYAFGDPKGFRGKASVAFFNGNSENAAGKVNDSNAMKDFVYRLEFWSGSHNFGLYGLQGSTDQKDPGIVAQTFAGGPTASAVIDNKDKTTNLGAFYGFRQGGWRAEAEYITGLLGRRFASLAATAGAAKRQHLDQKFNSLALSGSYTAGQHTFGLRFDTLNMNAGDDWYTATSPYVTASGDFTPKFTETTAGYTFAFDAAKYKNANIKVNYIHRSKNFLNPRAGQTGEQGGDSLVAQFQIAF